MAYEKVTPGQKIKGSPFARAAFVNDTIDVVNAVKEGRLLGGRGGLQGGRSRVLVEVRNMTGADRARGEVVQLGAHLLTAVSEDHPWFDSDLVAAPVEERLAILTKPLKSGQIGPAQMAGVCLAKVDVSDVDHTHAMPSVGATSLSSCEAGPVELLMLPTGTGLQDLWILMGAATQVLLGRANANIAQNEVGAFTIYIGPLGSESTTGITRDACAKLTAIDLDDFAYLLSAGLGWYAIADKGTGSGTALEKIQFVLVSGGSGIIRRRTTETTEAVGDTVAINNPDGVYEMIAGMVGGATKYEDGLYWCEWLTCGELFQTAESMQAGSPSSSGAPESTNIDGQFYADAGDTAAADIAAAVAHMAQAVP